MGFRFHFSWRRLGVSGSDYDAVWSKIHSSLNDLPIKPGGSLSRKLRPITEPVKKENWRELVRCKVCGTHWRVDAEDKFQTRFVWKMGVLRSDWSSVEFVEKEKALLLQCRGGESDETCAWLDCDGKKVKGVAYCVDHFYAIGARQ